MSFVRYSNHKDSGVEWLGEVPEHWEIRRLFSCLATLESGAREQSETSISEGVPSLGGEHVGADGRLRLGNVRFVSKTFFGCLKKGKIEANDVLLVKDGATIGKAVFIREMPFTECGVNEHVFLLRAGFGCCPLLLYYNLISPRLQQGIWKLVTGAAQPGLNTGFAKQLMVCLPPAPEQAAIAAFLDRETAKIDELVVEQRRLMDLLKEKRQAVISHAVTKGLNPDAPLKPSGIEWLGDIPAHWEVVALKRIVSHPIIDGPHESPKRLDEGIPFMSAESVAKGFLDFEKKWGYISQEDHERYSQRYKPKWGDILLVKLGATTGTPAIVETEVEFNIWVPLAAIRPAPEIEPRFIFHVLRSDNLKRAYELGWTYGTQQTLGLGTISNLRIPLPPKQEREEIARQLDSVLPSFDALTAEAQHAIDLLQERRAALISAAVTGQIDVRQITHKVSA